MAAEIQNKSTPNVFISYAWEGSLAPKEWLSDVIKRLGSYGVPSFFDRHSIAYGDDIARTIDTQLALRPLLIVCICDSAYCLAARTPGTGVHAEVLAISRLQGASGVAIVPVLLEPYSKLVADMPPLLAGRLGLALSAVKERNLDLAYYLLDLVEGENQEVVQGRVDRDVWSFDLRSRLEKEIAKRFRRVSGNAKNHFVKMDGGFLDVPACMRSEEEFAYYIELESRDGQVRWWWSGLGLGTRYLGAAIVGNCFPAADFASVYRAGCRLAEAIFKFIYEHEGLHVSPEDVARALTVDTRACRDAELLLATLALTEHGG